MTCNSEKAHVFFFLWTDIDTLLISPRHCPLMPNTFPVGRGHGYIDTNQNKNPEKLSISAGTSTDFTNPNLLNKQQLSVTLDWHSHIIPPCRYKSSIYPTLKCPFSLRVVQIGFKMSVNRHMAHYKVHALGKQVNWSNYFLSILASEIFNIVYQSALT